MLWLDLLRTPMAAPETPALRRMRYIFQALCVLSALSVAFLRTVLDLLGQRGAAAIFVLLAVTCVHAVIYLTRKSAADNEWLDQAQSSEASPL